MNADPEEGAVVGALERPHTIGVLDWAAAASAAHMVDDAGDAIYHEPSPRKTMAGGEASEETEGWSAGKVASVAGSVGCIRLCCLTPLSPTIAAPQFRSLEARREWGRSPLGVAGSVCCCSGAAAGVAGELPTGREMG